MGDRFCRMWEFYLLVLNASFRRGDLVVFQAQLERSLEHLPLTRDDLYGDDSRTRAVAHMPLRRHGMN